MLGGSRAAARQDADAMATHPIVGVWMVTTPIGPSLAVFSADGINIQAVTTTQPGPNGVEFVSAQAGLWEPDGDRRGHFTAVQALADADGAYLGTVTIDGHPEVSEDGEGFVDADPRSTVTIRDAAGAVVQQVPAITDRPVTARRMAPGRPGFPEVGAGAATPAATPEA
jgi:hypothetical protein